MADEPIPTGDTVAATATAEAITPAPKRPRTPRAKKPTAEAKAKPSRSKAAKAAGGSKQRVEGTPASSAEPATAKRRAAKEPVAVIDAPVSAADEMAELLQLEEENSRLRKSLAEKLRAENASLRKKLGLA